MCTQILKICTKTSAYQPARRICILSLVSKAKINTDFRLCANEIKGITISCKGQRNLNILHMSGDRRKYTHVYALEAGLVINDRGAVINGKRSYVILTPGEYVLGHKMQFCTQRVLYVDVCGIAKADIYGFGSCSFHFLIIQMVLGYQCCSRFLHQFYVVFIGRIRMSS